MILREIIQQKKQEVDELKRKAFMSKLANKAFEMPAGRDFKRAISVPKGIIKLIAEIKRASPSEGIIRVELNPVEIAKIYEQNGASAISVVTDERFFQGNLRMLSLVKEAVNIPVLRKDFIIDESQIYESKVAGADAILLIAACLSLQKMDQLLCLSHKLGMECLVEVHTIDELERVLQTTAGIIGINNRNLYTFEVKLNTTFRLKVHIPSNRIVVSESGISKREDIELLREKGVDAVLVGTSLLKSNNITQKMEELVRII